MTRWPHFTPQCRKDVDRVLRSGRLTAYRANRISGVGPTEGSEAYELEREVEKAFKVRHAVACSSGTAALHAAILSSLAESRSVRRQIITSPYTFSGTAAAIIHSGFEPVFADVDPHTFCITKETVAPHVTKKTAAILPVNLFGYLPDLSPLLDFGLPVLEDACQSVGASRGGTYAGTFGVAGAYSFNGSKNLPSGEGGCLVTNDSDIAEKARRLCNHGENFDSQEVGLNYRMTELHACLARHGLRELEGRNYRRQELASIVQIELARNLQGCPWDITEHSGPFPQFGPARGSHVYYVLPFTIKRKGFRSRFISRCAKRGLTVGAGYITPHLGHYPAFKKYMKRPLPVVEELSTKTLCILSTLTPEKPLSYARKVARIIRESLE